MMLNISSENNVVGFNSFKQKNNKKHFNELGSSFEQLGRPHIFNTTYQAPRSSNFWFWRIFLKGFTLYGRGGHLGHVTRTIWTNCSFPIIRSLHMEFEFNWPSGFREDIWKCWLTKDGWHSHWYTISSTHEQKRKSIALHFDQVYA